MTPEHERRARILFPYAMHKLDWVRKNNTRFVHYTNAEVACSIIENASIWMRNSVTMNDFSEISYGTECLEFGWRSPAGEALRSAITKLGPNLVQRLEEIFFDEDQKRAFRTETYLTSFSEHDGEFEDRFGRLSMWRAYGGLNGVALVVKNSPFLSETDVLGCYSSPVAYWTPERFAQEMGFIAANIERDADAFGGLEEEEILALLATLLLFALLCTKHPGFSEEREWRVIYTPRFRTSALLTKEVRCVKGVPQTIFKIPLKDIPEEGLRGIAVKDVFDKLIIGPTLYPYPAYLGLVELLQKAGMEDAPERVHVSAIPLRVS